MGLRSAMSSNVVGGCASWLPTGVVGRPIGVELAVPRLSPGLKTGIDILTFFLSPSPLADADLDVVDRENCEFLRVEAVVSSDDQVGVLARGAWPGESTKLIASNDFARVVISPRRSDEMSHMIVFIVVLFCRSMGGIDIKSSGMGKELSSGGI